MCMEFNAHSMYEDGDPFSRNTYAVPRLRDIAIISTATKIWKEPDLRDVIERHVKKKGSEFYRSDELYKKVDKELSFLQLPKSLHVEVGNASMCLGRDFMKLAACENTITSHLHSFLKKYLSLEQRVQLIGSVNLDEKGLVDLSKVLELLLAEEFPKKTEKFIEDAYELACTYCQESLVDLLWKNHVSCELKSKIRAAPSNGFVSYWTRLLENQHRPFAGEECDDFGTASDNTSCSHMMGLSVDEGVFHSVVYFWSKIQNEEISRRFKDWIQKAEKRLIFERNMHDGISSEATCLFLFLFSKLNADQKTTLVTDLFHKSKLFEWQHCHKLASLFHSWHLRSFFVPMFQVVQGTMSNYQYRHFMVMIHDEINCSNAFASSILWDIWCASCAELKESFVDGEAWLSNFLLSANDITIPCMILRGASDDLKEKVTRKTLSDTSFICKVLKLGKLQLLEELMVKTLGSATDITGHKKLAAAAFTVFVDENCSGCSCCHSTEQSWQKALELLSWSFGNQDEIEIFKSAIETDYIIKKVVLYAKWVYSDSEDATEHSRYECHLCSTDSVAGRNYGCTDKFLEWYFDNFEDEKYEIMRYHAMGDPSSFVKGLNDWKSFGSFVRECFGPCVDEMKHLKAVIGTKEVICNIILKNDNLEEILDFADEVLTWCFDADKSEIKKFKCDLLLSKNGQELIYESLQFTDPILVSGEHVSEQLAEWFKLVPKWAVGKFIGMLEFTYRHAMSSFIAELSNKKNLKYGKEVGLFSFF